MLIPLGILGASGAGIPSDYELIESVILGTATSSVTFSSLATYASTYKHFQVRMTSKFDALGYYDNLRMRINGDTGASSYAYHGLSGNGSTVSSAGAANQNAIIIGYIDTNAATSGIPTVIDVLDPHSTSKNTTVRGMSGRAAPTDGNIIRLASGVHLSTSAISSITLFSTVNLGIGSRFSLYGLKG
jgi:hypothetical protein